MNFRDAFHWEVTNTSAISTLIGSDFYPAGDVPQGTDRPYATWQVITAERHPNQSDMSICMARVQVNCVADKAEDAAELADTFISKFGHYRDAAMGSGTTVAVRSAYIDDESDEPTLPTDGSERGPAIYRLDIIFWFEL